MAVTDFSVSETSHTPAMAKPGFGKRAVPLGRPPQRGDFAHLPKREAAIASYIDRLPEGAAIGIKTLAGQIDYGQCAIGTALRRLAEAGHLRRIQERLEDGRWVTYTHFSRIARSDGWWASYQRCGEGREDADGEVPEVLEQWEERDEAYEVLARLGEADERMMLSAGDCGALRALAAEWLRRGATARQVVRALTCDLPRNGVSSPRAFAAHRLKEKMPPERRVVVTAAAPPRRMQCVVCGMPARAEALVGGVCDICTGGGRQGGRLRETVDVRGRVAEVRAAIRVARAEAVPAQPSAMRATPRRPAAAVRPRS